jgi:ribosome-associated protein
MRKFFWLPVLVVLTESVYAEAEEIMVRNGRRIIRITPDISIDPSLISMDFVQASGPGGQNVNKVATAVQLRFNAAKCSVLSDDVRGRLKKLAGRRMTTAGVLVIDARRFANQNRNRADAIARLVDLLRKAAVKPKPRRQTKPTFASKQRRLESKRRRGKTKKLRRSVRRDELS